MKNSDIKQMTTKELEEMVKENQALLMKQKINHAVSPIENPMQIRKIRRDIARFNTEITRRKLEDKNS